MIEENTTTLIKEVGLPVQKQYINIEDFAKIELKVGKM